MQVINYSHLFPTRYAFELEGLKGTVSTETFKEPSQREDSKKNIKKQLEERYQSGKNKWFFQPLRVRCTQGVPRPGLTLIDASFSPTVLIVACFVDFCSVY
jgi:large subunit ribosomal protein L27e